MEVLVEQVVKGYSSGKGRNRKVVPALKGVSFAVPKGEIFGLIGPDGAGKTTLFRILTTLLLPDSGRVEVLGKDVVSDYLYLRRKIGYMPGRFSLYQDLTVEENLRFFATAFGVKVEEEYDRIKDIYGQIEPFKNRFAGKLSGGMKQKLALSCALIHRPEVLFLDEPTTGVDPVSRREFWEMLRKLKESGVTIVVSTPYMDEAAQCDRIALISQGTLMSVAKPQELIAQFPKALWSVKSNNIHRLLTDLRAHPEVDYCFSFGKYLHVSMRQGALSMDDIRHYLLEKNHEDVEIFRTEPGIEDCFISMYLQEQV